MIGTDNIAAECSFQSRAGSPERPPLSFHQKENGLPNAQLNAWGMLLGSGREPKRAIPYHFAEFYNHQDKSCSGGEGSGFCQLDVEGFDFGS